MENVFFIFVSRNLRNSCYRGIRFKSACVCTTHHTSVFDQIDHLLLFYFSLNTSRSYNVNNILASTIY